MPTDLPDKSMQNTDEWQDDPPSKSQRKRDAREFLDVAEQLGRDSDAVINALPLPDGLRAAVNTLRGISAHGARKRQLHYLAKLLRKDPETTDDVRQALDLQSANSNQQNRQFHDLEAWRDRLIDPSDQVTRDAVTEFAEQYPATDIQSLRQLVRTCRKHTVFDEVTGRFTGNRHTRQLFNWLRQNVSGQ